jgi:hypothetical protein
VSVAGGIARQSRKQDECVVSKTSTGRLLTEFGRQLPQTDQDECVVSKTSTGRLLTEFGWQLPEADEGECVVSTILSTPAGIARKRKSSVQLLPWGLHQNHAHDETDGIFPSDMPKWQAGTERGSIANVARTDLPVLCPWEIVPRLPDWRPDDWDPLRDSIEPGAGHDRDFFFLKNDRARDDYYLNILRMRRCRARKTASHAWCTNLEDQDLAWQIQEDQEERTRQRRERCNVTKWFEHEKEQEQDEERRAAAVHAAAAPAKTHKRSPSRKGRKAKRNKRRRQDGVHKKKTFRRPTSKAKAQPSSSTSVAAEKTTSLLDVIDLTAGGSAWGSRS